MNTVQKTLNISLSFLTQILIKQLPIMVLGLVSFNVTANEFDPRQAVHLNEQLKAQIFSNMRGMLTATQSIIGALAVDDMEAVANYARSVGFKAKKKQSNDELHSALPKSFKILGKAMHMDFDKIADDAVTLKDSKHTLQQLADVLGHCQGCHETFRIDSSVNEVSNSMPVK